jgi:hypothetical protein
MLAPNDREYKATRRIKRGQSVLAPPFAELAEWISSEWHVTVLNVVYDRPFILDRRPRLQIIVEHSRERDRFLDELGNFDHAKQQAIVARFAEQVGRRKTQASQSSVAAWVAQWVKQKVTTRYRVEQLLVVFSAFAPVARGEADCRITDLDVAALQTRIADPQLWTIRRCLGHVTFMYYTDEQARAHDQSGLSVVYADLYFALLQSHDEFGYLSRSRFCIHSDSKEIFDKTYEGNWFKYDMDTPRSRMVGPPGAPEGDATRA